MAGSEKRKRTHTPGTWQTKNKGSISWRGNMAGGLAGNRPGIRFFDSREEHRKQSNPG